MTKYELEVEATKRAMKDLPPKHPKGDLRNLSRITHFIENYHKAVQDILEEEHDRV